jgi:hypothetical protein
MQRETKDKILGVVTMGAICLMAASPVVAQTDRGGSGAGAPSGRLADRMPGSEAQRMERSAYPIQSAQSGPAMTGDDATDLRGLPDPPETVRRVQQILKSEGYDPGPINGVLGPKTEEALVQYQQKHNIEATGWLDRETKAKLGV